MGYLIYRIANDITLWLCQNSTWKWPFIVDLPSYKMVIFHSFLYVYQRVYGPISILSQLSMGNMYMVLNFMINVHLHSMV